jgi:glycosyltransferase involved in cell wall biosynthesis
MAGGIRSYAMARRLLARGHRVTMVCGVKTSSALPLESGFRGGIRRGKVDGIDVIQINLPYSDHDTIFGRSAVFISFALRSLQIALFSDYDLLFATSTPLTAGLPGVVMKTFRRRPFVFEVRDLWPELPRAMGAIRNPLALAFLSLLEWSCYRQADAVIALAPGIAGGIRKRSRPGLPVAMIPNGSDLDLFRPALRSGVELAGVSPTDLAAVFTGAHGPANGLSAALDAARVLRRQGRADIKFVFIGDGRLKPLLQDEARRDDLFNCVFLDPVSKPELCKLLARADVGMMILSNVPAFYYGTSPNKFFDYLSCGLPILVNYPGWMADLVTWHGCGIAVPPDDPMAFAVALVSLANDPGRRRQMGINARALAETQFDRTRLADDFVDFLETVCRTC